MNLKLLCKKAVHEWISNCKRWFCPFGVTCFISSRVGWNLHESVDSESHTSEGSIRGKAESLPNLSPSNQPEQMPTLEYSTMRTLSKHFKTEVEVTVQYFVEDNDGTHAQRHAGHAAFSSTSTYDGRTKNITRSSWWMQQSKWKEPAKYKTIYSISSETWGKLPC